MNKISYNIRQRSFLIGSLALHCPVGQHQLIYHVAEGLKQRPMVIDIDPTLRHNGKLVRKRQKEGTFPTKGTERKAMKLTIYF